MELRILNLFFFSKKVFLFRAQMSNYPKNNSLSTHCWERDRPCRVGRVQPTVGGAGTVLGRRTGGFSEEPAEHAGQAV